MAECERVIHVLHSMNCGGAETLIMNVYRNIDRSKVQFDFLVNCFDEMVFENEIEQLGGRIFRMKFLTQLTPPVYQYKLCRFFREHKEYKIVHSHLETTTGIILDCAKRAGIPVRIAHSHNSRYTHTGGLYRIENAYKSYCKSKVIPNATEIFACSALAAKWLFGMRSNKAVIIKNGIETDKFRFSPDDRKKIRDELDISDETIVLGHVGRFYDQKNHSFIIDVFEQYEKVNSNTLLLLAGDGELINAVKAKVSSRGLSDKVKFLGLRNDVHRILQGFDVFLLPSKFEGLPLVLVEAQAAGLNCIVSNCVSKEADMGCGLITFLPITAADWMEKIQKIDVDREQKSKQVAAAGYDIKATAKWLEDYYCEMCSKAQ
jgi:glycosyltransferase involved in cell wall biosynthesis